MRSIKNPAIVLFFLSPLIAELLSGSAPPLEFFNPLGFLLLTLLYGNGALIVHELSVRWRKGWTSILILGLAYGIIEEGLMVKSFFDPAWMDLGILGIYGRWLGVNWVWAEMLTIYHAVFSIALPILIVELIFPRYIRQPWLTNTKLLFCSILFTVDIIVGYLFLTPYKPPVGLFIGALLATVVLIIVAFKIPNLTLNQRRDRYARSMKRFWALGFFSTISFFLILFLAPNLIPNPGVMMVLPILLVMMVIQLLRRYSHISERCRYALSCGALSFFVMLAPLQEMDSSRHDDPTGMTIIGLLFLMFLIWLFFHVKQRANKYCIECGAEILSNIKYCPYCKAEQIDVAATLL